MAFPARIGCGLAGGRWPEQLRAESRRSRCFRRHVHLHSPQSIIILYTSIYNIGYFRPIIAGYSQVWGTVWVLVLRYLAALTQFSQADCQVTSALVCTNLGHLGSWYVLIELTEIGKVCWALGCRMRLVPVPSDRSTQTGGLLSMTSKIFLRQLLPVPTSRYRYRILCWRQMVILSRDEAMVSIPVAPRLCLDCDDLWWRVMWHGPILAACSKWSASPLLYGWELR